jgi:hypothetical protein
MLVLLLRATADGRRLASVDGILFARSGMFRWIDTRNLEVRIDIQLEKEGNKSANFVQKIITFEMKCQGRLFWKEKVVFLVEII